MCRCNAGRALLITMLPMTIETKSHTALQMQTQHKITLLANPLLLTILALRLEMNRRVAW